MIPQDQVYVDAGRGDCMRAAWASVLELPLEAVPHFRLLPKWVWISVFKQFLYGLGYNDEGSGNPARIQEYYSIKGHFVASVKSRTFPDGAGHSVVLDTTGMVVHDPNPNRLWFGSHVSEDEHACIYLVEPRIDESWKSWLEYRDRLEASAGKEKPS